MEREINQQQFSQSEQKGSKMKNLIFVGIVSSILGALIAGGIIYFALNNSYSEKQKQLNNQISALQNQIKELEKQDKVVQPTPIKTQGWETYQSPIHKFSFQYPQSQDYEIFEDGGMGFTPGKFGSSLSKKSSPGGTIFTVDVFYTPEWTTVGNAYGDVDALEKGFKAGGVEEVAKLSREVNLQKEKNIPNKQVDEMTTFRFYNGTGYGFTVTGSLNWCFNVSYNCGSGRVVESPLTIVYVTNGRDIYRIEFPVNSLGDQIFSTFKFTE